LFTWSGVLVKSRPQLIGDRDQLALDRVQAPVDVVDPAGQFSQSPADVGQHSLMR
jgi:hypothetical protein